MRRCLSSGMRVFFLILFSVLILQLGFTDEAEIQAIEEAIKAKGADWTAGESWVTRLDDISRRSLLGEMTLELGIIPDAGSAPRFFEQAAPTAVDWRNKDGENWVTPIRDQQSCGSCVAFGSIATLESLVRVEYDLPDLDIDLSEMHLFNCGGGSCSYGWYNSAALYYMHNYGVPDEDCWPYQPVNRPCEENTCPDWESRAVKITDYGNIQGIQEHMDYVAISPVLVSFEVYSDFYSYSGGIYEHTWGSYEGGHAVSIVGYDTTGAVDYWIVKNSWGPSWGENGFFKIKMGECNIENRSSYWLSGAILPDQGDVSVTLIPDGYFVRRGGNLGMEVVVTNNSGEMQTVYFATDVTLPNGGRYPAEGYLYGPRLITLDPYESKSGHISHPIPLYAQFGTYTYHGYVGTGIGGIIDEDQFNFYLTQ